ncbi:MAG: exodeoxyribonuclease III [bacterium]|jgi:exodeoxyribonuclease-3|nr:exodeoxyribonuclease III [candidate division KSB1 bacterium]MDH7560822.1 exodeoxyribonuclease III [bacterium]
MLRMLSWNVNGLRAILGKGFLDWLAREQPDVLCLQETKVGLHQLPEALKSLQGYHAFWVAGEKPGYSGVALLSKKAPLRVQAGFGVERFDKEGRTQVADYGDFVLYNVYFPNGKASAERLRYKMDFYEAFLAHVQDLLSAGRKVVVGGDVNTAHKEIDLARPKENEKVSGFLPEERAWVDRFLAAGFVDTFRLFTSEGGHYSWWDYKSRARERNVGWRIDYFFVSRNLVGQVRSAFILPEVMGSDHCPVGVELVV